MSGTFFDTLLCVNIDNNASNNITHKIHLPEELFGTPALLQCTIKSPRIVKAPIMVKIIAIKNIVIEMFLHNFIGDNRNIQHTSF